MSLDIQNIWPDENPVEIRAAAALPAAGAYDPNPTEIAVAGIEWITLYFAYTRGGAGGAFDWQIQVSPYSADTGGNDWFAQSVYAAGAVVAGVDTTSNVQREENSYQATGAAVETFVLGPIRLAGTIERIRIPCQESGNVGAPGNLEVMAVMR